MRLLKIAPLVAILLIGSDLSAFAGENWKCSYHSVDGAVSAAIHLSQDGDTLRGVLDDFGGQQTLFKILANTPDGLVAVAPVLGRADAGELKVRLKVIVLDKRTDAFQMTGYVVGTRYEDAYLGKCVKN